MFFWLLCLKKEDTNAAQLSAIYNICLPHKRWQILQVTHKYTHTHNALHFHMQISWKDALELIVFLCCQHLLMRMLTFKSFAVQMFCKIKCGSRRRRCATNILCTWQVSISKFVVEGQKKKVKFLLIEILNAKTFWLTCCFAAAAAAAAVCVKRCQTIESSFGFMQKCLTANFWSSFGKE